ncbi:MAG TPA: long-chain fatty acid--CoA ligase, partial [Porphyromonadaceae bacterium]|nr:long-chain fatty acid--CoA ligase [Porphyromonadaceae bacterium]
MAYYHLGEIVHRQALKYRHKTALKYQDPDGKWVGMFWESFSANITKTAQAMAEMGVKPGDNLGIYSQNMEKYLITDFAAYANRAVMVPMYATASPAQVSYIVQDAAIRILFVGEQFQYNNAWKVQQEN